MDEKTKTLQRISALTVLVEKVVSRAVWVITDESTPVEYSKQQLSEALQNVVRLANEWIAAVQLKK